MLQTMSGKVMPPELFLQTVMDMDYEPGLIGKMMGTSQSLREILSYYQYSISRRLAAPLHHSSEPCIRSSSPRRSFVYHSTYPWLHEMHTRSTTISLLKTGPLLSLENPALPLSAKAESHIQERILPILYELSDLGQLNDNSSNSSALRDAQEAWIASDQRTKEDLAILYAMIHSISDEWRIIQIRLAASSPTHETTETDDPQHREEDCVYRECCLIYGPYFLQASVAKEGKDSAWYHKVMDEGMRELRTFEEGKVESGSRGSLQGIIIRRFCDMVGCGNREGWTEVWRFLESLQEESEVALVG